MDALVIELDKTALEIRI